MPYLHCPQCRLTVYSAAGHSTTDSCPRCEAELESAPRTMFAPPSGESQRGPVGRHEAVRKALMRTGRFRDGRNGPGAVRGA